MKNWHKHEERAIITAFGNIEMASEKILDCLIEKPCDEELRLLYLDLGFDV